MEKELNPDVIKRTQVSLGKYVKRPPLSEKLLKKPPFRFLHDIFTTVLKTTGFFENLFEEEELESDNVKARDSKIIFLNKVIFVITSTTGKPLSVKPSKIVAGQEPAQTNELLQCLALALDKKLSSEEAVKKYKESAKAPQPAETKTKSVIKTSEKKGSSVQKLTSRSSEKLTNQKNDANPRVPSKNDKDKINDSKSKKKEISKTESQTKKSQQMKLSSKKSVDNKGQNNDDIERKSVKKAAVPNVKEKLQQIVPNKLQSQDSVSDVSVKNDNQTDVTRNDQQFSPRLERDEEMNLNDSYTIREHDLNSTSSSHDLLETTNVTIEENQSLEIKVNTDHVVIDDALTVEHNKVDNVESLEQSGNYSDRPKHGLVLDNEDNESDNKVQDIKKYELSNPKSSLESASTPNSHVVRPASVRPSSSRPGAPRMREKVDNVVRDSDNLLLGKVNIIVESTQNEEDEDSSLIVIEQQKDLTSTTKNQQKLNGSSNEHGHLVQQILESQKELSQIAGKTEIEWQFGAQKAREAMNQEIEQLRFNIQALSRFANPLGKLLDHIQEDVEVMRQELQQWSNSYDEINKEMLKQKALNEDSLSPLHTKLKQLDRDIEEKHDKINDLKVLIHKNRSRIEKLLASGDVQ